MIYGIYDLYHMIYTTLVRRNSLVYIYISQYLLYFLNSYNVTTNKIAIIKRTLHFRFCRYTNMFNKTLPTHMHTKIEVQARNMALSVTLNTCFHNPNNMQYSKKKWVYFSRYWVPMLASGRSLTLLNKGRLGLYI